MRHSRYDAPERRRMAWRQHTPRMSVHDRPRVMRLAQLTTVLIVVSLS